APAATRRAQGVCPSLAGFCCRQGYANDLPVVPGIHAAVGKRRVRPHDLPAEGGAGWLKQVGPANLFVAFGAQLGDDQIALLRRQEEAIPVLDQENIRRTYLLAAVGFQRTPQALAGVGLDADELAVAGRAVNMTVFHKGRAEDAVEAVLLRITLPGDLGAGLFAAESQHERAAERRGKEQIVSDFPRRRDRHRHVRGKRHGPVDLAALRIQAVHRLPVPDDELPFACRFVDHGRAVTEVLGVECPPQLFTTVLVERYDRAAFAAHHANELLAVE